MEYFVNLKLFLCRRGILQLKSDPKANAITIVKRCGLFASCISLALAPAWFFLFEAQTPRENSISLICALNAVLVSSWYLTFIFQSKKFAEIFDELSSIIEKSKLKMTTFRYKSSKIHFFYSKLNRNK